MYIVTMITKEEIKVILAEVALHKSRANSGENINKLLPSHFDDAALIAVDL